MNKTNTPIFDAVLSHLRATGELPNFGGPVEARLSLTLHSGGGCSPDVLELSWANESLAIVGIDPAIVSAWSNAYSRSQRSKGAQSPARTAAYSERRSLP